MIKVENDTVEVRGKTEDIICDLTILLNTLMRKEKQGDFLIACAVRSAKRMIAENINGTDLSDSVDATLKRPK